VNFLEQPDGLIVLDVDRRTYAALSRDESYWHLIQPASEPIARGFDYVDANGLTVTPVAVGDLTCTCAGGRFKRHCYRIDQAKAFEQRLENDLRWGIETSRLAEEKVTRTPERRTRRSTADATAVAG